MLAYRAKHMVLGYDKLDVVGEVTFAKFLYLKFALRNTFSGEVRGYHEFSRSNLTNPVNKSLNELLILINQNHLLSMKSIMSYISENGYYGIISYSTMTYNNQHDPMKLYSIIKEGFKINEINISNLKIFSIITAEIELEPMSFFQKSEFLFDLIRSNRHIIMKKYAQTELIRMSHSNKAILDLIYSKIESLNNDKAIIESKGKKRLYIALIEVLFNQKYSKILNLDFQPEKFMNMNILFGRIKEIKASKKISLLYPKRVFYYDKDYLFFEAANEIVFEEEDRRLFERSRRYHRR